MRIGGSTTCDNLFRFHCPILHVTRATASSDTSSRDFYQKMKRLLYMRHKTIMFSSQKRFNVFPPRSLSLSLCYLDISLVFTCTQRRCHFLCVRKNVKYISAFLLAISIFLLKTPRAKETERHSPTAF